MNSIKSDELQDDISNYIFPILLLSDTQRSKSGKQMQNIPYRKNRGFKLRVG